VEHEQGKNTRQLKDSAIRKEKKNSQKTETNKYRSRSWNYWKLLGNKQSSSICVVPCNSHFSSYNKCPLLERYWLYDFPLVLQLEALFVGVEMTNFWEWRHWPVFLPQSS